MKFSELIRLLEENGFRLIRSEAPNAIMENLVGLS